MIGFEGLSYAAPGYYALQVFTNAVGGGMSSRLFQEVRENRGLAYTIYSFHWGYADTGLFGFYGATSRRKSANSCPVALECLAKAAEDLSEAEIDRAKAQMKVSQLTALESSTARSEQIARQILAYGRVLSRDEILARIDNLTVNEIRAAGAAALRTVPTVAAVGPVAKVHTPDRVRELVGRA